MHLNLNLKVTLTKNKFNLYQHLRYNDDKVCHYHDRTIISFCPTKTIKNQTYTNGFVLPEMQITWWYLKKKYKIFRVF